MSGGTVKLHSRSLFHFLWTECSVGRYNECAEASDWVIVELQQHGDGESDVRKDRAYPLVLEITTDGEALEALTVNGLRLGHFEDAINRARKDAFVCQEIARAGWEVLEYRKGDDGEGVALLNTSIMLPVRIYRHENG